jgi:valyl-tRNA synthetase
MTEKRQTSQGYIIRILQHFATKLWNITNFVMLFLDQNFTHKGKGLLTKHFGYNLSAKGMTVECIVTCVL